jgi:hypothetical protein
MRWRVEYLAALLLLAMVAGAVTEHTVKFVSSSTNENGVKIILVRGNDGHPSYTLACNEGQSDCVTPDVGVWYTLRPSSDGKYSNRENVALVFNGQVFGNYFLVAGGE